MITYDYVYDFLSHPYQSEFLDQDSEKCTQSFRIPEGVQPIHGLRVKLSKYGHPGPIHYSLGRQPGEDGIATGIIQQRVQRPHTVLVARSCGTIG